MYYQKAYNSAAITIEESAILRRLHRYATTLHRLDENACNGHPMQKTEVRDGKMYRFDVENEAWKLRDEKKEASIMKKIEEIKAQTGWEIELQGDPRGWPMKLTIRNIDCSYLVNKL